MKIMCFCFPRTRVLGVLAGLFIIAASAEAVVTISITGLPTSDQFTVTASGSGATTSFGNSSGSITKPTNGNFVNNTQAYSFAPEGGATLQFTTINTTTEEAVTGLNIGFDPDPITLALNSGNGPIGTPFGSAPITASASGTATFIIPGDSNEATFGELFNTGTFSRISNGITYEYVITAIPEPSALGFGVIVGLAGLVAVRRRKDACSQ